MHFSILIDRNPLPSKPVGSHFHSETRATTNITLHTCHNVLSTGRVCMYTWRAKAGWPPVRSTVICSCTTYMDSTPSAHNSIHTIYYCWCYSNSSKLTSGAPCFPNVMGFACWFAQGNEKQKLLLLLLLHCLAFASCMTCMSLIVQQEGFLCDVEFFPF